MNHELKKILFVDDDPDIIMILEIALTDIPNVELRSALSGEEAIKILLEFEPDLILLDVMMPNMDGILTLQTIRQLPSYSKVPVVFLTAKAQKNEIEEYFKHGVLDVIVKPFDPLTLGKRLQKLWNEHSEHNPDSSKVSH